MAAGIMPYTTETSGIYMSYVFLPVLKKSAISLQGL